MTEKPRAAAPGATGSAPGGSATAGQAAGEEPRVVIRDKRKISKNAGQPAAADAAADAPAEGLVEEAEVVVDEIEAEAEVSGPPVVDAPAQPTEEAAAPAAPLGAELESLRAELDERTRDLQRVSAEYANYRKRVDRDRSLVQEQATGSVLAALLPILDDLDRAREHGDLVGPFGTVAEQLTTALGKFGLTAFGEQGDPFDPTRHEAVAHQTSADVTEPTCVQVMRRGYQLGERLLRPALVAVADPE
ncbi:nucleotide exchange factor GrpE [Micromonospora sp. NBC_00898]|uniref:nucleotide exchange factor GrpE n=1 Tax=Micromonospora sp. NBC_00898 TaxID=2975981 RepID=UPI0038667602|nr:nucleotide exchange factor GrpE [Micromonospora sp. NBC_00898]